MPALAIRTREAAALSSTLSFSTCPRPPLSRSPFELTLHAWLTLFFLPVYKRLVKEKKRGTGKKHL